MLKTFSRFSIEKSNVYFSDEKFQPLTIDPLLLIHERFWDLNFKLCFPNDKIKMESELKLISIDFFN
jgi:hypothetical protein